MNLSSRSSKNLFRERSISSMPSRQASVMKILHERESVSKDLYPGHFQRKETPRVVKELRHH